MDSPENHLQTGYALPFKAVQEDRPDRDTERANQTVVPTNRFCTLPLARLAVVFY